MPKVGKKCHTLEGAGWMVKGGIERRLILSKCFVNARYLGLCMVTYVNTKVSKMIITIWFIGRDFVDNFKVYGETVAKFRCISPECS